MPTSGAAIEAVGDDIVAFAAEFGHGGKFWEVFDDKPFGDGREDVVVVVVVDSLIWCW